VQAKNNTEIVLTASDDLFKAGGINIWLSQTSEDV
jgi:hypothetical protein